MPALLVVFASFDIDGETMICLPQVNPNPNLPTNSQAYDLFLKNLVGGLHTVYTKLKRLDVTPRVCNVEQVRLRKRPTNPNSRSAPSAPSAPFSRASTDAN